MKKVLMLILVFALFAVSASAQTVVSAEYGNGWQKICYSDGNCAYSNHETYLRWDDIWIPVEWLNISNGNWSYAIQDLPTKMNFTAGNRTISIPKANTKFNLQLFKISPSLTYTKTTLLNNMVSVNATVAYLTFPYNLSQIKDWADDHNIRVGRWIFQAGQEHIDIFDDVLVNHTFVNMSGKNETYLAVTTMDKSAYDFRIVNGEIRLYFLKSEANKMSGNITFQMNSWTVGEGGNAWTGNSSKDNTTLNRDTNHIMLRQEVDDYNSYWRFDRAMGTVGYDENISSNNNAQLINGTAWNSSGKFGNALNFNGVNNSVSITDSNSLSFKGGAYSLCIWVKRNNDTGHTDILLAKETGSANTREWFLVIYLDDIYFVNVANPFYTYWIGRKAPDTTITKDIWHYLVGTYDGSSQNSGFKIYVDGIRIDNEDYSNTPYPGMPDTASPVTIGKTWWDTTYLSGLVDDVRIYSRNISSDEINLTMNNTMKSSGILTTWYSAEVGNETYQIDVNATTDENSNYTVWYENNGTGSYSQLGGTLTGNNTLAITGTKYQNTDVQIRLAGNTTSTPEIATVTFWTESIPPDTSFTVSLPNNCTEAFFNATTKSSQNVSANCQNASVGFLYITNTGNVNLKFYALLNSSQPAGVTLKSDTDNNPAGATTIDTSLTQIISNLDISSSQYVWLWADYSNALPMTAQRTLSVNSS